jgi:hypothetical protein
MTQPDEEFQGNQGDAEDILRPATEDIEAPPADAFEQTLPADPIDLPEAPPHVPPEVSEADAVEQALLAVPSHEPDPPRVPFEVSEADAIEQAQTVEMHDDYDG